MGQTAAIDVVIRGPDAYRVARKAMDAMVNHKVWPTPANYELWLHYAANPASPLATEIDRIAAAGEPFTEGACDRLTTRFLPKVQTEDHLREAGDQLFRELDTVSKAIQAAHLSSEAYGDVLAGAGDRLEKADPASLRKLVSGLADATRQAEHQNKMLQRRLTESTSEVAKLRDNLAEVRRDAATDALTGLGNRKAFDSVLSAALEQGQMRKQPVALAVLDIDHFKRFNDNWGHQTGDQVLRYVASVLGKAATGQRFAARYGGEEFALICPGETAAAVQAVLQDVLDEVGARNLRRRSTNEELGSVTVSAGLAEVRTQETAHDLVERADAALYASKRNGRNRITNAGKAMVEAA